MVIERRIRVATLTHKQYLIRLGFIGVYYVSKREAGDDTTWQDFQYSLDSVVYIICFIRSLLFMMFQN